jgi:hypothetical protein
MNRLCCLALAVSTVVLTSYLVGQSVRGLSPGEMGALRGGNDQVGKYTGRCDVLAGLYLGCTKAGASCHGCAKADEDENPIIVMVDYLQSASFPDHPGGFKQEQDLQLCGNLWTGKCETDPTSPTGFTCVAMDTGVVCTYAKGAVGPQPD